MILVYSRPLRNFENLSFPIEEVRTVSDAILSKLPRHALREFKTRSKLAFAGHAAGSLFLVEVHGVVR